MIKKSSSISKKSPVGAAEAQTKTVALTRSEARTLLNDHVEKLGAVNDVTDRFGWCEVDKARKSSCIDGVRRLAISGLISEEDIDGVAAQESGFGTLWYWPGWDRVLEESL